MELASAGHPLHARCLGVCVRDAGAGRWRVEGDLLDLRKGGFVPVGGDLQMPGILHHMQVTAEALRDDGRLERIEVAQPVVAFEPSEVTGGESCRDPASRCQRLVGGRLDAGFAGLLGREIGGPRGCTHVLTLLQLVGATLPWARAREEARRASPGPRARGARVFQRSLVFDGARVDGAVDLCAQLTDVLFRPATGRSRPLDRLSEELTLRLQARIEPETQQLVALRGARRLRGVEDIEEAPWVDLSPRLAGLVGLALRPGVSREILGRHGEAADERPLLDVLLNLTPAFFQCLANVSDRAVCQARWNPSVLGMAGLPDSCFMWRTGGALDRAREQPG